MARAKTSTISFRVTDAERRTIQKNAQGLTPGEFARRAALGIQADNRIDERKALGKVIRAINIALAAGIPTEREHTVRALIREALRLLYMEDRCSRAEDSSPTPGGEW